MTPDAPAGAREASAAAPAFARPVIELPRRLPVWRFYLYCLASAGLFLVAWIFLTARALSPSGRCAKCVGWALASLFPPFGCLVLFDLCQQVARFERKRSRRRDSAIMPPLWLALLAIVVTVTPLRTLFIAHVALLAVPYLVVQARITASTSDCNCRPRRRDPRRG